MTIETKVFCNRCENQISVSRTGGETSSIVHDIYMIPPVHYRVVDRHNDVYDFCSATCLGVWTEDHDDRW